MIAALVRLGAKLDEPGQGSCIPLQMASANGNLAAAKELIRQHKLAGVDIDTTVSELLNYCTRIQTHSHDYLWP